MIKERLHNGLQHRFRRYIRHIDQLLPHRNEIHLAFFLLIRAVNALLADQVIDLMHRNLCAFILT